jgi:hypothetical protein
MSTVFRTDGGTPFGAPIRVLPRLEKPGQLSADERNRLAGEMAADLGTPSRIAAGDNKKEDRKDARPAAPQGKRADADAAYEANVRASLDAYKSSPTRIGAK